MFDENEIFSTESARKASARIDSAILTAVKFLNTIGEDLFNLFVSATDALRVDHTELFLYCDGKIDGSEYRSGYFMPGDWLNKPCDDREAIRAEVYLCNAVIDRILEKMPADLSNYEKCCYFAFVLAAANEYDYSETVPTNDYQAYNAFVKGKTICSGYAQAFYRLCREAGISCWYCRGTTPEGHHAWNMPDTDDGVVYRDSTFPFSASISYVILFSDSTIINRFRKLNIRFNYHRIILTYHGV